MIVVSNASPLIILSRIGQLALLRDLFSEILVSQEVHTEVVVQGKGQPGSAEVEKANWIQSRAISDRQRHTELRKTHNLGSGEVATLILGAEVKADLLLIDEKRVRIIARQFGQAVIGTVGVLELGYRRGLVRDLRSAYQEMQRQGIRIDQRILNRSLAGFGLPSF